MSPHPPPPPRALRATAALLLALLAGPAVTTPILGEEDCDCGDDPASAAPAQILSSDLPGFLGGAGHQPITGPPRLDLFVMSLCPYGMEAEQALVPLVAGWGEKVDFHLHFIADEAGGDATAAGSAPVAAGQVRAERRPGCAAAGGPAPGSGAAGPFSSLHGQPEVDEDRRQLTVAAHHPEAFLSYLMCRARGGPGSDWRPCARAVGLDPDAVDLAARGPGGQRLLSENLRTANRLGINLSPTLLVDGVEYTGRLEPFAVGRTLCARQPDAPLCGQWPACGRDDDCAGPEGAVSLCLDPDTPAARCHHQPPVAFDLHVLEADPQRCPACDADRFLGSTVALFPGARVHRHPQGEAQADSLAQRYGAEQLPAYILSQEFAHTARFERVQHLLADGGDAFVVRPRVAGTTYWPRRPHRPGRLDVFLPATAFGASAAARGTLDLEDALLHLWPPRGEGLGAETPLPATGPVPDLHLHVLPDTADGALRARVDSLSLRRDEMSALVENRILSRGIQLEELVDFWHANLVP